ncbi:MAG: hypothetical protein AB7S38_29260 [Vulcanimicrobiota bacterium]
MKNLISLVLGGLLLGGLMFGCGGSTPPADNNSPAVSTPAEGGVEMSPAPEGGETPAMEETPMSEGDSH